MFSACCRSVEGCWIYRDIAAGAVGDADFEVKVGAGGVACAADFGDDFSLVYVFTVGDSVAAVVSIDSHNVLAFYDHQLAVAAQAAAAVEHFSVMCSVYWCAARRANVHAFVKPPAPPSKA